MMAKLELRACARRSWSAAVVVVGVLLCLASGATAQTTLESANPLSALVTRLGETWRWRSFDSAEGLPSNSIHALYQDSEFFVYAATDRGVCRYNLWKWAIIPTKGVFAVGGRVRFVESARILYVATETGLWREQSGELVKVVDGGSLFAAENRGTAFVLDASNGEYYRIRGLLIERLTGVGTALPQGATVLDYRVDTMDEHWLATSQGLFRRRVGSWQFVHARDLARELDGYRCVRLLPVAWPAPADGAPEPVGAGDRLWGLFQSTDQGVRKTKLARLRDDFWSVHGRAQDEHNCPGQENFLVESAVADARGNYLVATDEGQLSVSRNGCEWSEVRSLGPGDVALQSAIVDSSGAIWFRKGTGGIALFDAPSQHWESLPAGRPFADILSLLQTRCGDVWMGLREGLSQYDAREQRAKLHESALGIELRQITGLEEDVRGRVWLSSATAFDGAVVFDRQQRERPEIPGFSDYPISRIVRDVRDPRAAGWDLWFLSREPREPNEQKEHVLYRLSREQVESGQAPAEPMEVHIAEGPINDLLYSKDEKYWLASDAGLLRASFDEGSLRFEIDSVFRASDGLLLSTVLSIAEGPDGAIWACQPYSGVSRVRGDVVENFTQENGLKGANIWSIASVGKSLWFGTDEGLSRYSEDCWFYYPVAGRAGIVRLVRPALDELDGLLIGTHGQGALRHRLQRHGRPRFTLKDFPDVAAAGEVVEFRWEARDHRNGTAPADLLYRYRLDGKAWSSFGSTLSYVAGPLEAGSHSFQVEARDLDGNRNRGRDVHRFVVDPAPGARSFWWAIALLAAGVCAAGVLLTRLFLRRRRRQRQSRRYGSFYRHFPSPVFLLAPDGRVADFNGVLPELVGLDGARQGDILGRPLGLFPLFAEDEVAASLAGLSSGKRFVLTRTLGERHLEVSGFLAAEDGAAVVIVRDRTARVEIQRHRERERRLTSLRSLSDQVALVVRSHLDDLRDWHDELLPHLPEKDRDRQQARLDSRLEHLEKLSRSLAVFSGAAESGPLEAVAAAEVIEQVTHRTLEEAERGVTASRGGVRFDSRVQTGLWPVRARLESFADALGEILRNAWQSLPGGGVVTVRASNLRLEEAQDPGALSAGPYVEIVVRDTGVGITETQIENVFDPFFSTQRRSTATGASSGVGLSLAYGVIRSHGGDLRIESQPTKGTTVRIIWPAAR
jgi:signal transduction histidine kinase/ligand-binding sensor domain-containing protein